MDLGWIYSYSDGRRMSLKVYTHMGMTYENGYESFL